MMTPVSSVQSAHLKSTSYPHGVEAKSLLPILLCALVVLCCATACGPKANHRSATATQQVLSPQSEKLTVEVIATYPHDPTAYTQGLLWADGWLIEGTGQYGHSTLRRYQPGDVDAQITHTLDSELFGEGITLVDGDLYQLTWKSGRTFVYEPETLKLKRELSLQGEGWGLEYDGEVLIVSDGTHVLTHLDPETLKRRSRLQVKDQGSPVGNLNELELVGDALYANVYETERIVKIDAKSGVVLATIDASGLLSNEEKRTANVLNGIAYREETDTFFVTGKFWPHLFEVRFVPKFPN